jgi:hypothetical protein
MNPVFYLRPFGFLIYNLTMAKRIIFTDKDNNGLELHINKDNLIYVDISNDGNKSNYYFLFDKKTGLEFIKSLRLNLKKLQ